MPEPSENRGRAVLWGSLLIAAAVLFVVGGFCGYFYHDPIDSLLPHTAPTPSANGESEPIPSTALGHIEPKDGSLLLGVPVPDRIAEILVTEGKEVKSGQRLVRLESEALRKLEVDSSAIQEEQASHRLQAIEASGKAQIEVEKLRLQQVEQFAPLEMQAQRSKIDYLVSQVANAKEDHEHLEKAGDSIAQQRKDKQKLLWQQAQEELSAAKTQKQKLRDGQSLDRKLANARVVAAQAELKRSENAISLKLLNNQSAQAAERLQNAKITAPRDGTILRVLAHKGDLVQGKPIVQMANLDEMIVVAEVRINDKRKIKVGDRATITSPVFDKELGGKVYFISNIVGKPKMTSPDPLETVDYRIVEVKILLDQNKPADQYIGHEVKVTIRPGK